MGAFVLPPTLRAVRLGASGVIVAVLRSKSDCVETTMSILYLSEDDVHQLLSMEECVQETERVFLHEAEGRAEHKPTHEFHFPQGGFLRLKAGACYGYNTLGWKAYGTAGRRRIVYVYNLQTGLDGILDAMWLTQMRTGAVSAVATKYMARPESSTVGIIGSGKEAPTQLAAIHCVRPLKHVKVYSRTKEHRERFAADVSRQMGVAIDPVDSAEECVRDVDIVVTMTSARDPIVSGPWLAEGTHINGVGATGIYRRELDEDAVARCAVVAVEHLPVAHEECGELIYAAIRGKLQWSLVRELKDLVSGTIPGRGRPEDITLFDSIGIGSEDVAIATYLLAKARARSAGTVLPM
jgi:alanine dehydrogenase